MYALQAFPARVQHEPLVVTLADKMRVRKGVTALFIHLLIRKPAAAAPTSADTDMALLQGNLFGCPPRIRMKPGSNDKLLMLSRTV